MKKLYLIEFSDQHLDTLVLDDTQHLDLQVAYYMNTVVWGQSPADIEADGPMFTTDEIEDIYPLRAVDPNERAYKITLEPAPVNAEPHQ